MLVVRKGKGLDVVAQRAAIMSARLLPSLHIRQKHIQIRFQWCSNVVTCFSSRNFSINLLACTPSFHKKVSGLNFVLSVYFTSSFKSSCSSGDIAKMFDMAEVELLSKLNKILGSIKTKSYSVQSTPNSKKGCLKECTTPKK